MKSVLFPSVVKSLCNNTEILKLINKYQHGIGYNRTEEIEAEYALMINKQKENRVIIPREIDQNEHYQHVTLMKADNIDNLLVGTLSGSEISHRVNAILVMKGKPTETDDGADEAQERPAKRKCK